jgi:hypothetical protein
MKEKLPESKLSILVVGVLGPLSLAFGGLLIGAWLSQFFVPAFPTVIAVPLAMNVGVGLLLIKGRRAESGNALLYGGIFASVALPLILL